MKTDRTTEWDVAKAFLCNSIRSWQKQEGKSTVTIEDVIEYAHANGLLGGIKWDKFVRDIPEGWDKIKH